MAEGKKNYNENYIMYRAKCHKVKDADIIEYMESIKNKQEELKRIIRNEREKNGYENRNEYKHINVGEDTRKGTS